MLPHRQKSQGDYFVREAQTMVVTGSRGSLGGMSLELYVVAASFMECQNLLSVVSIISIIVVPVKITQKLRRV